VAVVVILLVLLDQPVLDDGLGAALGGGGGVLALDLDGHALVLLQRGRQVGLLGRGGGLGHGEGGHLAGGVGLLDGRGLVGLELLEVELLDEVGCGEGGEGLAFGHCFMGVDCGGGRQGQDGLRAIAPAARWV